eukprot:COSAG03_NODE_11207_length_605_cov_1.851779_2_plen_150_part_00
MQYYQTRHIYPRNVVAGNSWQVGKEAIFQFESDPASGWLVPDQTKLYCRFRVGAHNAANDALGTVPSKAIRLAACPLLGMFDNARWSMNGTTIQSVSGDLDFKHRFGHVSPIVPTLRSSLTRFFHRIVRRVQLHRTTTPSRRLLGHDAL